MRSNRLSSLLVLVGALGLGCAADIGESCDKSGDASECVDEAICTADPKGSGNTCRKRCSSDSECNAATEACNGVSGTNIKSCQPK